MAGLMVQPADAHEVVQMLGTGHQQHQRDQKQHRCFISSDAFVDDVTRDSASSSAGNLARRRVWRDDACLLWLPRNVGAGTFSAASDECSPEMRCVLQHMSKCRGRSDAVVVVLGAVPGG